MSIFDNTTRVLNFPGYVYTLKVQGYQFPLEEKPDQATFASRYSLVLKSYIQVFETADGTFEDKLIGMLASSSNQALEPTFVKMADPNFHSLKAEFIGEEGFNSARVQLANFSYNALLKGIENSFLDGGVERDFVFDLCWFNVFTRQHFSVDTLNLKLVKAPQEFTHDFAVYTLARTEVLDSGAIHCVYILRERTTTLERDFVLKTYRRSASGSRQWLPANELRLKLYKAPPFFTDQGVRYQLEGKTVELEDGTIYANYIPTTEDANKGGSANGIL